MQMISSKAGTRLARAKVLRDDEQRRDAAGEDRWPALRDARQSFVLAAEAVADELIADKHHTGED